LAYQEVDAGQRLLAQILKENNPQSLPRAFPLAFSLPGASGDLCFDAEGNRNIALRLSIAPQGRFRPD